MNNKIYFITALIAIIITSSLNGMDPTSLYELRRTGKKPAASDFEIYQLLSTTQDNPDFYLPKDLIKVITVNADKITKQRCYETHKYIVENGDTLLAFIIKQADTGIDIEPTVNIMKTCLDYIGKSLLTLYIKIDYIEYTVLHRAINSFSMPVALDQKFLVKYKNKKCYIIDALCQAAGKNLMELLYAKDSTGYMPLTNTAFEMCGALVWAEKKGRTKENLESVDLLNWKHTPDYVKVILKYVDKDKKAQLIFDSHEYHEKIQRINNPSDDDSDY